MVNKEISIRISGQNGDGIFSSGETLAKICSRSGLEVHGSRSYQSIIRGGHVSYSVRASSKRIRAPADYIDVLVALRQDSFKVDVPLMMRSGGVVVYDSKGSRIKNVEAPEGVILYDIPAAELAAKYSSLKIMMNTVLVGASIALYKMDLNIYKKLLTETFSHKSEDVINSNIAAAEAGYNWILENATPLEHNLEFKESGKKVFMGGNEALAFGLLNGGLQSFDFYPMTPATPIGIFLAQHGPANGCAVKQMEDEINVANYAVGAAFAGARSAVATSGGGFALMTEAVGFASIIEAPVVYIEVSRGGPSTGLPTKQEQGDLNQLLGASQGDFPRAIIAQVGVEEGFYLAQEALNIADKYQMPVLIASDLYTGEHFETLPPLDYDRIPIDRGELITEDIPEDQLPYKRYLLTESGISPRTIPGVKGGEHDAGSDEHDEFGVLVSDRRAGFPEAIEVRLQQMNKRMKKMENLLKELPAPELKGASLEESQILVVTWGSMGDIVLEAIDQLAEEGIKASNINIKYIMPFHSKEVGDILRSFESAGKKVMMVEGNYSGQMAKYIRSETSFEIKEKYLRYDGENVLPREVAAAIKERL